MTTAPSISVVIAAYNAADYISTSIQSVLAQSITDIEVIVVDDGSVDATAATVGAIADARIRLIRQDNRGQSAALNAGADHARGRYIKFVDADDWLNPDHLASQLEALAGWNHCVASSRWGYFTTNPRGAAPRIEATNRHYADPLDWLVDSLTIDEGMMGGWMWLIPRAVWDRAGGWNESLTLNNDFDFSVRLLLASEGVRFAANAMYAYRKGVGGALSGRSADQAMQSAFATTESGCRHLLEREDSIRVRRICADRWQWWLYHFYPEHAELARRAEREVARLGGSSKSLEGGLLLRVLLPAIGWKGVRQMQAISYRLGWGPILRWKERRWVKRLDEAPSSGSNDG